MGIFASSSIIRRIAYALFLLLLAFPCTADEPASPESLHAVYFDGYQPYSYAENGQMKGAWVAVVDEACKRLNIKVTHEGYPWACAQAMVRGGLADAMLTTATEERLTYALDAGYVVALPGQTYTWASNPQTVELNKIQNWSDLQVFSVVSYLGNGIVKRNLGDAHVAWQPSEVAALKLLALHRYDITVDIPTMITKIIKQQNLDGKIVAVGPPLPGFEYKMMIGKQSKFAKRAEQFAKTLDAMQRDGTIAKIIKENGG